MVHGGIIDWIWGTLSGGFRSPNSREVAVKAFGSGKTGQRRLFQLQSAMQKTTRASGIDQKPGAKIKWFLARVANDRRALVSQVQRFDPSAVPVIHSKALRLPNQEVIHVGSIPMRIGNIIVRARRHQQLILRA